MKNREGMLLAPDKPESIQTKKNTNIDVNLFSIPAKTSLDDEKNLLNEETSGKSRAA